MKQIILVIFRGLKGFLIRIIGLVKQKKANSPTYFQPTSKSLMHENLFLTKGLKDFSYTCSIIREEQATR